MGYEVRLTRKSPAPAPKKRPRLTRQRRKRMNEDEVYLAIRDEWLLCNPYCARCGKQAWSIHHILRGSNRQRALLNSDTWLGCCSDECHDAIEKLSVDNQIKLKCRQVRETIRRLRA